MSKKDDRLNQFIKLLEKQNGMTVRELALALDVSEMTIRRDLETLKEKNVILDVPGVAVLNNNYTYEDGQTYHLSRATHKNAREKERMGRFAATLIEPYDCIFIDNGSTTEYLADNLPKDTKLTVFTSNLNILNKICNNSYISIIFGGGYYHPETSLFECSESIQLIKKIRATKVFISAAGVHETMGITCMNNYELSIKQEFMRSGAEKILLVDSSKFGVIRPSFLIELDIFDRIITDDNLSEEWIQIIRNKGIKLNLV